MAARIRRRCLEGSLLLLIACAERHPSIAGRLDPDPLAGARASIERPLAEAWQLGAGDLADEQRLASVRLGNERRPARLLTVPFRARVHVPAGVHELRLARSPASAVAPGDPCTVRWTLDWSAGARVVTDEAVSLAGRDQRWLPIRLRGRARRQPTLLELGAELGAGCGARRVTSAVAQILALQRPPQPSAPTNVLLVVVDALRRDRMDCGPTSARLTPELARRLCPRGLFFADAVSTSSWTFPAIASLHTGLLPYDHGARRRAAAVEDLDPHVVTLAELLQWHGYHTAGFVPNPYAARGLWRGFDSFVEQFPGPGRLTAEMRRADQMVDTVSDWLRRERTGPFFAFLLLLDVHEPVDAAQKLGQLPPSCAGVAPIPFGWEGLTRIAAPLTAAERARLRCRNDLYDVALGFADTHLARLLDTLDELGLGDDTAVIVTSDHGEELLDHALAQRPGPGQALERWGVDHGHTMYQELLAVPMLIVPPRAAGLPAGQQRGLVSLADLFATTLGLAGVPPPPDHPARDLLDLVRRGQPFALPAAVSQNTLYGPEQTALTHDALKVIRAADALTIFDRRADPTEQSPLPADHPLAAEGRALADTLLPAQP